MRDIEGSLTYEKFAKVDAEYYEAFLADVRARWPELRAEGYRLLAQRRGQTATGSAR